MSEEVLTNQGISYKQEGYILHTRMGVLKHQWDNLQTRGVYLTHKGEHSYQLGNIFQKEGYNLHTRERVLTHQRISYIPEGYLLYMCEGVLTKPGDILKIQRVFLIQKGECSHTPG